MSRNILKIMGIIALILLVTPVMSAAAYEKIIEDDHFRYVYYYDDETDLLLRYEKIDLDTGITLTSITYTYDEKGNLVEQYVVFSDPETGETIEVRYYNYDPETGRLTDKSIIYWNEQGQQIKIVYVYGEDGSVTIYRFIDGELVEEIFIPPPVNNDEIILRQLEYLPSTPPVIMH